MPLKIDQELIVNAPRVLGVTSGLIPTTPGPGLTGVTTTSVRQPVQTLNTIFKAADPNRVGLAIFNNSTANLFVKLGASANIGAGTESYTRRLAPNEYYEVPFGYTGRVDGIWDAADATGEALLLERFTGFTPLSIPNCESWLRADQGVTNPGGAVPSWVEHSGNNRNLIQTVGARQPSQVAGVINGFPVVNWGTAANDHYLLEVTPWAASSDATMYMVIQFEADNQFQMAAFLGAGSSRYLENVGNSKPMIFAGAPRATWSADLVPGTNYLVKWATSGLSVGPSVFYTQVNDDPEVMESVAGMTALGSYTSIGIDPAITATQDMISAVAERVIYSRKLTAVEEAQLRDYWNSPAKYALF